MYFFWIYFYFLFFCGNTWKFSKQKLKSSSTYTYESSINTDANGKYTISSIKDATVYDFQIEISSLTISSPSVSDAQSFNQKVLSQSFNSRDYYRMDVNENNDLNKILVGGDFTQYNGGTYNCFRFVRSVQLLNDQNISIVC